MRVEIDPNSGFCAGVIRAINGAEGLLAEKKSFYSLGAIVHNEAELSRLHEKGLVTITLDDLAAGELLPGSSLLIRAHGEPPATYELARSKGCEVVDFTCPVVLHIQKTIREAWESRRPAGQIIIFGKIGHAEVLGLVGQVDGNAVVVENLSQLEACIESGAIDCSRHVDIFSQTTKSPVEYAELCVSLSRRMASQDLLDVHNTICRQVAGRHRELGEFAMAHDVIVFVSGKASSNGRVLFDLCSKMNSRSYQVGDVAEVREEWFRADDNVGVCGATSTPKWLLEKVADYIKNLH